MFDYHFCSMLYTRSKIPKSICICLITSFAYLPVASADHRDSDPTYEIKSMRIVTPLSETPGDPVQGEKIVAGREGNCLACHKAPIPTEEFHGNLGPSLFNVGNRYDEAELRLRIVDPKAINPGTIMPAFFKVIGLQRVAKQYRDRPILNAQQIEDVIAYLQTLTYTEE